MLSVRDTRHINPEKQSYSWETAAQKIGTFQKYQPHSNVGFLFEFLHLKGNLQAYDTAKEICYFSV